MLDTKFKVFYQNQLFEGEEQGTDGSDSKSNDENKGDTGASGVKTYTDEEVNAIIDRKFAKWQKDQQKKIDEAAKLAGMSEKEKAEHERDELQKKYDALVRQQTLSDMSKTARKLLQESDINVSDEIIGYLVSEDAEETKTRIADFTKSFQEAVKAEVKAQLAGKEPQTGTQTTLTKEEILKVKDRTERQKLINENIKLFK